MTALIALGSIVLILIVLIDTFETMLLPRRVRRQFRFARIFYVYSWAPWAALARWVRSEKRRNTLLSLFGPSSILVLIAIWAVAMIMGFALLHWAIGTPLGGQVGTVGLGTYAYFSGVTFFTLGYGDVTPVGSPGRFLAVVETGIGFGFLALVISYLPVLYQAFSRREIAISLLDARAGSPPTAGTLLGRLARFSDLERLDQFLGEWEHWAAEVLESHISFPVLSYYRSQHDNQSWLAALTAILDTAALVIAGAKGADPYQAQLTFATARHTVVDLAQAYHVPPIDPDPDRLPEDQWRRLQGELRTAGVDLRDGEAVDRKLAELRGMYEPFVNALARHFLLTLPPVHSESTPIDNWQTSAWMRRTSGIDRLALPEQPCDDHRD